MNPPAITIIQGTAAPYPAADINIVIDVIRAFTVAQIAFMRGVREIFLVNTTDEAFAMKKAHPGYLLAGEIEGLPIAGFDLDNSPQRVSTADIAGKTLVQKTSNGVKATLLALDADTVLVTGLANAKNSALYARRIAAAKPGCTLNIIASHAGDDDDLACAEYIRDIVLDTRAIDVEDIKRRVRDSRPAQKFYDPNIPAALDARDITHCAREVSCDFVMQVDQRTLPPRVVARHM